MIEKNSEKRENLVTKFLPNLCSDEYSGTLLIIMYPYSAAATAATFHPDSRCLSCRLACGKRLESPRNFSAFLWILQSKLPTAARGTGNGRKSGLEKGFNEIFRKTWEALEEFFLAYAFLETLEDVSYKLTTMHGQPAKLSK
ncbi:hypothetical protein MSG28_009797 [Choristoneura fumiferana]|uniref:Uncharacterized protein n=1 Tax=Choristoneura fumiferana TaxID=7141 RepID=A0ACC0JCM5_CHOFU|nr:hypothetical protein MSG28_009797 [Choristoneura fumiferana]